MIYLFIFIFANCSFLALASVCSSWAHWNVRFPCSLVQGGWGKRYFIYFLNMYEAKLKCTSTSSPVSI
jgi:hypothetical protein